MSPTPPPLHTHISSLLDAYITTFNDSDLAAAATYYDAPTAIISASTGTTLLPSHADFIATFTATLNRLKADGWTRSEYVGEKTLVVLVADALVLASCPCRRLRGDGSCVEEFTAVYTLRRVGEGEARKWLICAIQHAEFGRVLRD